MPSVILRKTNVIYSHQPQTGKITGSHLHSGSFAQYARYLLPAPKGYKCCQLIRLFHSRFTWRQHVEPHNFSYDSQSSDQDLNLRPSKHKPGELINQMYHLLWFILFTIDSSGYCVIRKWYKLPMFKTIFLFPPVSLFPPFPGTIYNPSDTTFVYSDHESGSYVFWNVSNLQDSHR